VVGSVFDHRREILDFLEILGPLQFLGGFLRCHVRSPFLRVAPSAVTTLICNSRSNVRGLAKGALSPFDSERRRRRSDVQGMLERWKNHQRLNISTKTNTNEGRVPDLCFERVLAPMGVSPDYRRCEVALHLSHKSKSRRILLNDVS
jgi:hypothetical protein